MEEFGDRPAFSVSLRHLKLFESVGRLSSVRKASEECFLSQPAVTQAIAKLESQLGVSLFERRASGSYLNNFGTIFQRRTRRLFDQIEAALVELGVSAGRTPAALLASRISKAQMRSLLAIAENGSFARAARTLDVCQGSLHRAARDLERTLGAALFVQTATGIAATPTAMEFARKVKLASREVECGIDEIEVARSNSGGEIVVGAMLLAGSVALASIVNEFASKHANANIRVLNGNAEELLRALRAGDVDVVVGLLRDLPPEDLITEPLAQTPYVVAARHGHPLTRQPQITLENLAEYDWVVGTPGASRRLRFDALFEGAKAQPRARIATCSIPVVRSLLSGGDRLTLLTTYELLFEDDLLSAVPFGPIEPAPSVGLTMRQNWMPTELQGDFINMIRANIVAALNGARDARKRAPQLVAIDGGAACRK